MDGLRSSRVAALYGIFFLSGVAGLGYEIVWTRMFAIGLGHEMPSVLAVVAAFFGGLGLGAWALDGRVSRSARPGRWYAALELVIGGWAAASVLLVPAANRVAAHLIGVEASPAWQWLVAFAVPFAALLPATAAMGATLPAMDRLVSRGRGTGRNVGGLYGVNTAGAVAGTLAATFVAIPALGFRVTLLGFAAINVACAAAVLLGAARGETRRAPVTHEMRGRAGPLLLGVLVAATGLLGIGYEVLGVRVMAQVLENTVYSFASALSVYLVGTAAGAAIYQRVARDAGFVVPLALMLQGLCVTCLLGIIVLQFSKGIYEGARTALGGGFAGSVAGEMLLALLVFGAPTLLMGATFSHLAQAARGTRGGVGRALALNTIAAAAAPLLFGVVLLPAVGAKWSLSLVAFAYLLLVLPLPDLRPRHAVPSVTAILVFALVPGRLVLVAAPEGSTITDYRDGVMAAVAVVQDPGGARRLKVNERFYMGGTLRPFADRRQAHIPLLLHGSPRRALFLGLGTGITAGAATLHPGLEVRGVELVPEVVELLPRFAPANRLDRVPPGAWVVADARRFVRAAEDRFDVIVADLFHPARDGAGALYTVEHFRAVRGRLAEGGLFCQWLPLYQLDLETTRLIARTFLAVFPGATAWIAHFNVDTPMLGLVAGGGPWSDGWLETHVAAPALAAALEEVALGGDLTLFGCLLAGRDDLRRFAGEGPLNTDDRPLVVYAAPAFTYRGDESGWSRIEAILAECAPHAGDVLGDVPPDDPFAVRLDGYLAARDLYLEATILLGRHRDAEAVEMLLASVRTSPFFVTAYTTGLQLALDRRHTDPDFSRSLLAALAEANPDDPRASELLK